jgi:hypothetical protein
LNSAVAKLPNCQIAKLPNCQTVAFCIKTRTRITLK